MEIIQELEEKVRALIATLLQEREHSTQLKAQLTEQAAAQAKLPEIASNNEQNSAREHELQEQIAQLQTQLLQEQERFRVEITLVKQQYDHSIAQLNQALAAQLHNAKAQAQAECGNLVQEAQMLRAQNEQLQNALQQSRSQIAAALHSLDTLTQPAAEAEKETQ